jgi:ATP-dependent RNA helicase DeaD
MVSILKESLDEIIAELPTDRKTILFSATMPGTIKQLCKTTENVVQVSASIIGQVSIMNTLLWINENLMF